MYTVEPCCLTSCRYSHFDLSLLKTLKFPYKKPCNPLTLNSGQRAKKVVSDSPGLVDLTIGLVIFVFN